MKITAHQRYAVLTGDVVDSSKLPSTKRSALPGELQRASKETRQGFPKIVPLDAAIFRGDGWQLLVSDARQAVRVALYFRAALRTGPARGRGLDTRISIGIGTVDFVPEGRLSQGDGEAYRLSGRGLEGMPLRQQMVLATPEGDLTADVDLVVKLIDALARSWTGQQARAVKGALLGLKQEAIAAKWPGGATQSVVARHLEKANWTALEAAVGWLEMKLTGAVQL